LTARGLRFCLILLAYGAAVSACRRSSAPSIEATGTVNGSVSGDSEGTIVGARVKLRRADTPGGSFLGEAVIDESRQFHIKNVPAGEYVVESEIGGQSARVSLIVQLGETVSTVLRLAEPVQLQGKVVDRKGNAVPSAIVLLWRSGQGTNLSRETQTNEQGDFQFNHLATGNVALLVQAAGIGSAKWDSISLPSQPLHIPLEGTGMSLSGHVLGPKGPEKQATVRLGGAGLRTSRSTNTDATGSFTFQGLGPGDYAVRAGSVVLASGSRKTTIVDTDVSNFDLTMGPGEVVSGTVIDSERKPLAGATVLVQSVPLDECPEILSVDVVGYFSSIALPRGSYQVSATMPGFVTQAPQFFSINGRPPSLSIQVFRAGKIRGRLLSPL
jgi:protocatechuate 3,4-dioxygenase beta subunit